MHMLSKKSLVYESLGRKGFEEGLACQPERVQGNILVSILAHPPLNTYMYVPKPGWYHPPPSSLQCSKCYGFKGCEAILTQTKPTAI
eukprot:6373040-Amphidinium_carterae.1